MPFFYIVHGVHIVAESLETPKITTPTLLDIYTFNQYKISDREQPGLCKKITHYEKRKTKSKANDQKSYVSVIKAVHTSVRTQLT